MTVVKLADGKYDALTAGKPPPMSERALVPLACLKTDARRGYRIKGLLAAGDVMAIVGHPGSGKSTVAPYFAYAHALGNFIFGLRTKPGRVLYAAAEDFVGMKQRIAALYHKHGDAPDFRLVDVGNLRTAQCVKDLMDYVREYQPDLVVIDTIGAAFAGLDENSSGDMGSVVAFARSIANTGAAVILIHHIAKAGDGSPRGHSVLNGTLDACLLITMDAGGVCRGKLTKNRNGPCDLDIAFRIGKAELGLDEDDDMITAPIAEELAQQDAQDRLPPMTPTEKIALSVFHKITTLRDDGFREMAFEAWRDGCVTDGISGATKLKDQRQVAKTAIFGLAERAIVSFNPDDKQYRAKGRKVAAVDAFQAHGPQQGDLHALLH
jgi:hypothetical protein